MTDADRIAAFIASRGVTRVAEGTASYSNRSMYQAVRGQVTLPKTLVIRTDNDGQRRVQNDAGEWE